MKKTAALLLLSALLLSACTSEKTPVGGEGSPVSPTGAATDVATPTEPPEIFTEEDSVLDVAIPEPATLDPMRLQDPGSVLIARQLFEGLTRWDPERERVIPAAAESWKVLNGGRTFKFRLRQGMQFHDGTPVTSSSFRFAFERIALRANASDLAYTLELVDGFPAINQSGSSHRLVGISTPNDLTLVIRLSEPFYEFPAVLTHPGLVPLPVHAVRDLDRFLAAPTGNGPFQMAQTWAPGQPVILTAYAGFIESPDLDGIRFLPYPDAAASWLPFIRSDLDVAEVPAGQIGEAREDFGEEGFRSFLAGYYYGFNFRSPEFEDQHLRAAVNRAIDRKAIARTIYKGAMEAPRGIVPEGMPGFQENICLPLCTYSPDAAKRLIKKVPRKQRRVTIEYTEGDPHGKVARFVKEDLEAVGFKVTIKPFGFSAYLKRLKDGKQNIYRFGWIAEYPTPDVFLASLFRSGAPDNHFGFSSSSVDSLLRSARAAASPGRRLQLYVQAEKAILRRMPVIPIGSFVTHWVTQKNVRGLKFDVTGGFDAVRARIEED